MKYQQIGQGAQYPYPSNNIDPKIKQSDYKQFCLPYAKAAYYDWSFSYPKGVFANNGGDYEKFRMYALGKQPNSPYKKMLGVDQQTNNTWLSTDWSIRAIVSPYRDRAIARLMEQTNGIVATPIDITAKSELDAYYNEMKTKIALRQVAQQSGNQELLNHPKLALQAGDPMDMEELEMRLELGEQFNRAKDAEEAIELGFYENNYKQFRRALYEDLFDLGVGGYKVWLGSDNKAKFRKVNPENVITNFCRKGDFESNSETPDLIHAGEIIDVPLVELATKYDEQGNKIFTEEQLQEFASSVAGRWGNPQQVGHGSGWFKPYDKFKCKVLDLAFYSYDEYTYKDRTDANGNPVFRQEEYGRGEKSNPKYMRKCFRVVYQVKWIIGTEYCYDWGLMPDQMLPQNPKKKSLAQLPYRFYAYNFYEMKAQGFMERLIPYLDEYQLTVYKIQNWKNRAVPSGFWISLDALENVALNKGGANMQPKELLQMFFDTGVIVGRHLTADGQPMFQNTAPIIPIQNSVMAELAGYYNDLLNTIQQIERITGYNDVTMGEAGQKTLVPGYETGNISTNHALYSMKFAEEYLTEHLAEDVLLRMQQGIKKGGIEGYAPALNTNVLRFLQISPAIAQREYGIMLQEKTTDEQKMWILQQMQQDIANGLLDTTDAVLILNTHNSKQAMQILAYKVGKNKQLAHQQQMQLVQEQGQQNMQNAQATQQAAQQQLMAQQQFDMAMKQMELQAQLKQKEMELASQERMKQYEMQVKYNIGAITAEAKIQSTHISAEGDIAKQHLAGVHNQVVEALAGENALEVQKEANKKPKASSSK